MLEYFPKHDSQVQRLLATREDIFVDYTREACEKALEKYFSIVRMVDITDSERILYFLHNKQMGRK